MVLLISNYENFKLGGKEEMRERGFKRQTQERLYDGKKKVLTVVITDVMVGDRICWSGSR